MTPKQLIEFCKLNDVTPLDVVLTVSNGKVRKFRCEQDFSSLPEYFNDSNVQGEPFDWEDNEDLGQPVRILKVLRNITATTAVTGPPIYLVHKEEFKIPKRTRAEVVRELRAILLEPMKLSLSNTEELANNVSFFRKKLTELLDELEVCEV